MHTHVKKPAEQLNFHWDHSDVLQYGLTYEMLSAINVPELMLTASNSGLSAFSRDDVVTSLNSYYNDIVSALFLQFDP